MIRHLLRYALMPMLIGMVALIGCSRAGTCPTSCPKPAGTCPAVTTKADDTTSTPMGCPCRQGCGYRRGGGPGPGCGRMGDASMVDDRDTIHALLGAHQQVTRKVELIERGVRAETTSADPEIAAMIRQHVTAMRTRLHEGRPMRMWDPLFADIFAHHEQIALDIEEIPGGVRVTETSDDDGVVKLIQAHARAVSGFVDEGFTAAQRASAY